MYRITLSCGFVVENATYQEAWDAIKDAVVDMIAKGAVCVSLTIPWGDSEWYSIEA